jgi:AcrR family transcriptional regulator
MSETALQAPTSKGDRTRQSILLAAREQFQQVGYDRAGIRAIAAHAGIDPAMVMRYFGSKDGLFAAAVDIDLSLPDLRSVRPTRRGRVLVEHFLRRWEGDLADDVLILLLRSAVTNQAAANRITTIFSRQLVAVLEGSSGGDEAPRRAGLIASQLLGLVLTRYLIALPGIADRPAAELVAELAPTIQRYLTGRLAPGQDRS